MTVRQDILHLGCISADQVEPGPHLRRSVCVHRRERLLCRQDLKLPRPSHRGMAHLCNDNIDCGLRRLRLHRPVRAARPHGCGTLGTQRHIPELRVLDVRIHGRRGTGCCAGAHERPGKPRANLWRILVSFQ